MSLKSLRPVCTLLMLMCVNLIFAGNPSYVYWDLENCESNIFTGSNQSYEEFIPHIFNSEGCTQLSMSSPTLYRQIPTENTHSCAPGYNGGTAMCINSYPGCFYKANQAEALRFDINVNPSVSGEGRISSLSFYELAPEQFTYLDGLTGPNNYPTRYALTVFRNGVEVYHQDNIQATQQWSLEEFDFSNNPNFTVTTVSTFSFELLPYCFIGNGHATSAWDIDDIKIVSECGDGNPIAGQLTTFGGADSAELCLNGNSNTVVSFKTVGTNAPLTKYIFTDPQGTIVALPGAGPTFDFASAGPGVCNVYLVAHEGSLIGLEVGSHIGNLQGCFQLTNPVSVTRIMAQAGSIAVDNQTLFEFCGDPNEFAANPIVTGNEGSFGYWILTDGSNNVISVDAGNGSAGPTYNFSGLVGTQNLYHLSASSSSIAPAVGSNLSSMSGCYGLSNPITFTVYDTSPSTISVDGSTNLDVCGAETGALPISVTGGTGGAVYLITDPQGIILESQPSNTLDLSDITVPNCQIYVIRTAGNLQNFGIGQSIFNIVGCYSLSNPIEVTKSNIAASTISTDGASSIELCLSNNSPLMVDVQSTGGVGPNTTWVITDINANILSVQTGAGPIDFSNAGEGVCLLYEFYHEGTLAGAVVGGSLQTITGCYGRSNGITVRRNIISAGTISTENGTGTYTICEGSDMNLSPTLTGNVASGSQWLITDANNNLLNVQNDLPLNFANIDEPICFIYHLSSQGSTGLAIGQPVTSLTGCIGLSNQILVDKTSVQAQSIAIDGITTVSACLGSTSAVYTITASGNLEGTSVLYLITDEAGNILETQTETTFDFNGAGPGTCLIWQLVSTGGVTGAVAGNNASAIQGCFDLSNPVTVLRESFQGGIISGSQSICLTSGQSTTLSFPVSGATGAQSQYVLVGTSTNTILQISTSPSFDFGIYPPGSYTVYHIASNGGLSGLQEGAELGNITGCFALSNSVTVSTETVSAGTISSPQGSTITVCVGDGVSDSVTASVTGNTGANNQWLITDANGTILVTPSALPFDFEGAGLGTCNIYHLTYDGTITQAAVGSNIASIGGCFGLSNPITVVRTSATAGTLTAPINNLCLSSNQSSVVSYTVSGAVGTQSQFVLVGSNNTILQVSSSPSIDFGSQGAGSYTIYHVSSSSTVNGLIVGSSINTLTGCFGLSNGVSMVVDSITAGTLTSNQGSTVNLCNASGSSIVTVSVSGNNGANNTYVLTDPQGNILEITNNATFDFSNSTLASCLIWHLTYDGGLSGATIGANANNLSGCFGLSNPITVNKAGADGGLVILDDNTYSVDICTSDNTSDIINVNLQGGSGSSAWLITDLGGNILDVPAGPPFNFSNYPNGTCQIFHLGYSGSITGATIGSNTSNISGCFDLSNQITVNKSSANAGTISSPQGSNIFVCVKDGIADIVNVSVSGNSGDNSQWVITDVSGNILQLPTGTSYNFDNEGIGTCLIWHAAYANGTGGLAIGANAFNLTGCVDLSNSITVNKTESDGGAIALSDGTTAATFCTSDGISDAFSVNLTGNVGTSAWVVTDLNGNILDIPTGNNFDFEGTTGACQIWNLSYSGNILGATIGANVSGLNGCYDLSNPITITKNGTEPGQITGPTGTTYYACVGDGEADVVDISHTGFVGPFTQCVVTDVDGNILAIPSGTSVDFEGTPVGVCNIYCITYQFGLAGVNVGSNISNLDGCFSVSNAITVIRSSSVGGTLTTDTGLTEVDVCMDTGEAFVLNVELTGNSGENCAWVLTDEDGVIIELPSGPPFTLTGSGTTESIYLYNICYGDGLAGLAVDWPLSSLQGCYELSNPIEVNINSSNAGTISTANGSNITLCTSDGIPDEVLVINSTSYGQFSEFIVTDSDGNILEIQQSNIFNFEGVPVGVCNIYFVAWNGPLDGDFVGSNLDALSGCFDISNPIVVNRESIIGGSLSTDFGVTSLTICSGDGIGDPFSTTFANNSSGYLEAWVVTDENGVILDLPAGPTFDFEGSGPLTCHLYRITYAPGLTGLVVGQNKVNLDGCFGLSNPIEVFKNNVAGGSLELATGGTVMTVCSGDGLADPIEFVVTDQAGSTCDLVVTNIAGDILNITTDGNIIDLEGTGAEDALVYNVCYSEPINNYAVGFNISKWTSCYALSNSVAITKTCFAPDNGQINYAVFPNPARDILNINIEAFPKGRDGHLTITNMVGQEIDRIQIKEGQKVIQIDVTNYNSGAYLIDMGTYGSRELKRFIKVE